jgi:hypothetical protein
LSPTLTRPEQAWCDLGEDERRRDEAARETTAPNGAARTTLPIRRPARCVAPAVPPAQTGANGHVANASGLTATSRSICRPPRSSQARCQRQL